MKTGVTRLVVLLAIAFVAVGPAQAAPSTQLEFLGQQIFPTATQFRGTTFGGLSSITYDAQRNLFYAISDDQVKAYLREEAESAEEEDPDGLIADVWAHGQQESIREDLRLREALDRLVADVTPIAPDLAAARDKLWTPDKEKAEEDTKLWIPGSKEPA